jgi:hypothetical protein
MGVATKLMTLPPRSRREVVLARVSWGPGESTEVASVEELDRLLDDLSAKARSQGPFTVEISVNDRTAISAVLGRDDSHLEFYSPDQGALVIGCRGPWDDDTLIPFTYMGSYSELPRRYFVPVKQAREALRRYFLTGVRPENIAWNLDQGKGSDDRQTPPA